MIVGEKQVYRPRWKFIYGFLSTRSMYTQKFEIFSRVFEPFFRNWAFLLVLCKDLRDSAALS